MIEVTNVTKSYGLVQALQGVSFEVQAGEIVGLLGPNGAGKTTMMKILTGYLQQDEGSVMVDGLDVLNETTAVQARIGYLPENAPVYPELSVQSYLLLVAELRQIPEDEQLLRISEAVYATGLSQHLARPIGQLSKGYRQRVGLAQAILHRPKLLILDEPTIGLDPTQIVEIRRLIRSLAQSSTVLFSTHILSEVEVLCERVIILMNGQVRTDARLADLASTSDAILVLERAAEGTPGALRRLVGVADVQPFDAVGGYPAYRVTAAPTADADLCPRIFQLAREMDWPLRELRPDVRTLESVFNEVATPDDTSTLVVTQ